MALYVPFELSIFKLLQKRVFRKLQNPKPYPTDTSTTDYSYEWKRKQMKEKKASAKKNLDQRDLAKEAIKDVKRLLRDKKKDLRRATEQGDIQQGLAF